ncbi:MAG: hypothetical protein CMD35_07760 [Flavobacteriales bacterium]|nr:hypothetical protein [Flavobacteriales bacterium]
MDLSNDALFAAEKGLARLKKGLESIDVLKDGDQSFLDVNLIEASLESAMNDDFNTPVLVANLFDAVKQINSSVQNEKPITQEDRQKLKGLFDVYVTQIMGIQLIESSKSSDDSKTIENDLIQLAVDLRNQAKKGKDWETSDLIRNELTKLGIQLKDSKDGTKWSK